MPRQSRSGGGARSAPSRPMARPSAPAPQQNRAASTQAMPPTVQKPNGVATQQPQASQGPGLFGQMASTAAGVAVGSSIGHAIGGFFGGGGSSSAPVEQQQQQSQALDQGYGGSYGAQSNSQFEQPRVCGEQVTLFRQCMDGNQGDLNICGWYLEQLKACQQAASKY